MHRLRKIIVTVFTLDNLLLLLTFLAGVAIGGHAP